MAAGVKHILIENGADFRLKFRYLQPDKKTPVNLTGCAVRMQIRAEVDAPTTLADLTTENGKITIDPVTGTVTLQLSAEETMAMPSEEPAVYDVELVSPALPTPTVTRLLRGKVKFSPNVTR